MLEVIIQHVFAVDLVSGEFYCIIVRRLFFLLVQLLRICIELLILLVLIHYFTLVDVLIQILLLLIHVHRVLLALLSYLFLPFS